MSTYEASESRDVLLTVETGRATAGGRSGHEIGTGGLGPRDTNAHALLYGEWPWDRWKSR